MLQKPITKGAQGRRRSSLGVSGRPDGTVLPEKIGEPLNTRRVLSRNVFLVAVPRTLAAVGPESLDDLFINIREIVSVRESPERAAVQGPSRAIGSFWKSGLDGCPVVR
jgi:hypothetical protein